MGFLKKMLKKSVGISTKVATQPFKDAKKAVNITNKVNSKVGVNKLGMLSTSRGRAGKAPPVSTGTPAPGRAAIGGPRARMMPAGGGVRGIKRR
jgi:hypothetical protein